MIEACDLIGIWTLDRTVTDQGRMVGRASISDRGDGHLLYEEAGEFTDRSGAAFKFGRTYLYALTTAGLRIMFDENPPRLFQDIAIHRFDGSLRGTGTHECHPDQYSSVYEFSLPELFATEHVVIGPRKNYTIRTTYRRNKS